MKKLFGRLTLQQRLVLLPTLLCGLSLAALVSLFSYLGTDFAEKAALDTLQAATRERAAMARKRSRSRSAKRRRWR